MIFPFPYTCISNELILFIFDCSNSKLYVGNHNMQEKAFKLYSNKYSGKLQIPEKIYYRSNYSSTIIVVFT